MNRDPLWWPLQAGVNTSFVYFVPQLFFPPIFLSHHSSLDKGAMQPAPEERDTSQGAFS